jgi:hypothetical protein
MPFEEGRSITGLKYIAAEQAPNSPVRKDSVINVHCRDNRGKWFFIQVAMFKNSSFSHRIELGTSTACTGRFADEELYVDQRQLYILGIVNDIFDHESSQFYHYYKTFYDKKQKIEIDNLEITMIELPKFPLTNVAQNNMATLWLRFLTSIDEIKYTELPVELLEDDYIAQAIALCVAGKHKDNELLTYDVYRHYHDTENIIREFERDEGRKQERERIILNSFRNNLSVEVISAITGLPKESITAILFKK